MAPINLNDMANNTQIDYAFALAATHHTGQTDKQGQPYILHVLRVALAGKTVDEIIVGALHDLIEDCDVSLDRIKDHFTSAQLEAVRLLTRDWKTQPYKDYINEICKNSLATAVKIHDISDHLSRIHQLEKNERTRLRERYMDALQTLRRVVT